jgi:hypothetical protein
MSCLGAGFGGSPTDFLSCIGSTEFCLLRPPGCDPNDVLRLRVIDTFEPPPPRVSAKARFKLLFTPHTTHLVCGFFYLYASFHFGES